jgi:predicted acyl esterase
MKVRLWAEARAEVEGTACPDDMILCVFVDKRDRQGNSVRFNGSAGSSDDMVTRGYLRVSRRELDEERSSDWLPVLRGDTEHKLTNGEIVPVEIALCPSGTFFAAGESLRLIVAPSEVVRAPIFRKDTTLNVGKHVLHFGGQHDSYILLPVVT